MHRLRSKRSHLYRYSYDKYLTTQLEDTEGTGLIMNRVEKKSVKKVQKKCSAFFPNILHFFDLTMPIYLIISDSWIRR